MLVRWFENGLSRSGGDLRTSTANQSFVLFDSFYSCIDPHGAERRSAARYPPFNVHNTAYAGAHMTGGR